MKDITLNEWDIINPAIEANRQRRICWKEVFGRSLSQVAAEYFRNNYPWDFCYADLSAIAIREGYDDYESLKRLKISVCSMYAKKKT